VHPFRTLGGLLTRGRLVYLVTLLASPLANDLAVARWWPGPEQRAAYRVLAQVPPTASLSVQDR